MTAECTITWGKPNGHWELVHSSGVRPETHPVTDYPIGEPPPPDHGDRWNHWVYNAESLELMFLNDRDQWAYGVDLERCETSAAVLNWIVQGSYEPWISHADIGDLVEALDDIFALQRTRCPNGQERQHAE